MTQVDMGSLAELIRKATSGSTSQPGATPTGTTPTPTVTPPTPTPGVNEPVPIPAFSDVSARSIIDGVLGEFGLQGLSTWAWERYLAGIAIDQIMVELRARPEYAQRFPAIKDLQLKGRAISEGEYISYERATAQLMRQYGLPTGFYDQPEDFANLLRNEVSVAEVSQRLASYQSIAFNQDQRVRDELQRLYGITEGDLTAFFIDPEKALPFLQRRAQSAERAATALNTGYGALSATQAEYLTQFSGEQVGAGLSNLASMRELFSPVSLGEEAIDQETQLSAQFGGNAEARNTIERRRAQRLAEFQGGGGYSSSRGGITGVGSA